MANTQPIITSLDFEGIKSALKTYLKSLNTFRDFDFEGSAWATIIDVLAYHTFYNGYYTNVIGNEMFLDTAQIRSSVVSLAKHVGYTPRSARGAQVGVVITVVPSGSPNTVTIPQYTAFSAALDDKTLVFCTTDSVTASPDANGVYSAEAVLTQGKHFQHTFTVDTSNTAQKFVLPNPNIDSTTITVAVQASANDLATTVYNPFDGLSALDATSNVFFVMETFEGYTELKFGDGVIGRALENGNVITVHYLKTDGMEGNRAAVFSIDSISGFAASVELADDESPAQGGDDKESIDSIKYLAPLSYQMQGRAVTALDFKALILKEVGGVKSVAVWGGEEGDPRDANNSPAYGRVFISIKPNVGNFISNLLKDRIVEHVLRPRAVVTVEPVIIDPDYIYIRVQSTVKYLAAQTTLSENEIRERVVDAILNYSAVELEQFDSYFRYSKFVRAIDEADESITNNLTTISLQKTFTPTLGVAITYTINFANPLYNNPDQGTITVVSPANRTFTHLDSTGIARTNCFLEDDANGIMRIMYRSGNAKVVAQASIGTVDYDRGIVKLNNFKPTAIAGGATEIILLAVPQSSDILPRQNQLLVIDESLVSVSLYDDARIVMPIPSTGLGGIAGGGGEGVELPE